MLFVKIKQIFHCLFIRTYYKRILGGLGEHSYLPQSTKLDYPNNIFIGNNVNIGRMSWMAACPLTGNINCKLSIGDGTYIGNFAHIYCTSKIEIGRKVLIADRVYISDNLHSYSDINIPIIDQPIMQINEVVIDDGSWVGENVCIIGARVGKQCIIGANSVLTKDLPDYCMAVGAPAKIIKRFSIEIQKWKKTDSEGNFIE